MQLGPVVATGIAVLVAASPSACTRDHGVPAAAGLPWRFEVVRAVQQGAIPTDLDGDGDAEIMWIDSPTPGVDALGLSSLDGRMIEQINIAGRIGHLGFHDVDGRPGNELLLSFVRNDSLFLTVASASGQKLFSFLVTTGSPRLEPDGPIPWDPYYQLTTMRDVTGDGRKEMIGIVNTAYARLPRGVFIHEVPSGRLLDSLIIGAHIGNARLDDFDADGELEMLIGSNAVGNGARAGGFDDSNAYLILLELLPKLSVAWSRTIGSLWQLAFLDQSVSDTGGRSLLVVTAHHAIGAEQTAVERIEPGTWRTIERRSIREPLTNLRMVNVDRDPAEELVAIRAPDQIVIFDDDFASSRRWRFTSGLRWLTLVEDIDGDGIVEIAVGVRDNDLLFLNRDFEPLAVISDAEIGPPIGRRGLPPLLVVRTGGATVAGQFVDNPYYLVYRYGARFATGLGLISAFVLIAALGRARRRIRIGEIAQEQRSGAAALAVLVLDRRGRILWHEGLLSCLPTEAQPPRLHSLDDLAGPFPTLTAFCRPRLATMPVTRQTAPLELPPNARPKHAVVEMQPVSAGVARRPYWLVRITERPGRHLQDALAWPLVAARLTSSIRDPLASAVLTLKRLQHGYREAAPAHASELDMYSDRVEARLFQIRTVAENFLKLVDPQTARRVPVALNDLVTAVAARLRATLPPDISLELRLEPALPDALGDPVQIEAVLDNLATNAISAMPAGGVLTLATTQVENVQWTAADPPRSYVTIDVMDTGVGIDEGLQSAIFEPGFSTGEHRSGIGLAIVRRIIDDHEGHVTVNSEPGAGATFGVHLPALPASPRSAGPDEPALRSAAT